MTPSTPSSFAAPAITAVTAGVQTLATVAAAGAENEEVIAAVRKGAILATAFHPELTGDLRWHRYFLQIVEECKAGSA